jgi:hypothetical protein
MVILADKKAGEPGPDVDYPMGTVNFLANERLKTPADGLSKFGKDETKDNGKENGLKKQEEKEAKK